MPTITPFLWFDTQAEEAARYYTTVFPNSRILTITHYAPGTPMPEGMVMTVEFELDGQRLVGLNGGPQFPFTEAVSFAIDCDTQDEVDRYWNTLVGDGGEESQCGWLKDRYGLSWQVVPRRLTELLAESDAEAGARITEALMKMRKLDIAALEAAARG